MEFLTFRPLIWLLVIALMAIGLRYSLVDQPLRQRIAAFMLRCIGILLLILAMCRPYWRSEGRDLHVSFLLDVSQSVDLDATLSALDEINALMQQLSAGDSASLFLVANGIRHFDDTDEMRTRLEEWKSGVADADFRSESRLADALRETRFAFPAGKASRIVLFSDGQETQGDLAAVLRQLKEEQTDVRMVQLQALQRPEASVVAMRPSTSHAFHGEIIRMSAELASNRDMQATLRLVQKGVVIQEQAVQLKQEETIFTHVDVPMMTSGASMWTAELVPADDHFPLNNQLSCPVNVRGKARVLVLHEEGEEMRSFSRALREQDIDIDVRGDFGLPETMQGILAFDAVVIANHPATSMSPRQLKCSNVMSRNSAVAWPCWGRTTVLDWGVLQDTRGRGAAVGVPF